MPVDLWMSSANALPGWLPGCGKDCQITSVYPRISRQTAVSRQLSAAIHFATHKLLLAERSLDGVQGTTQLQVFRKGFLYFLYSMDDG